MSISFQHINSDSPPSPPSQFLRRRLYCRYMGCEDGSPYQYTEDGNLIVQPNQTITYTFQSHDDEVVTQNRYYLIPIYVLAFMAVCYFFARTAWRMHTERTRVQQQQVQEQEAIEEAKIQKQHEEDLRIALLHEIDIQNICMIVTENDIETSCFSDIFPYHLTHIT